MTATDCWTSCVLTWTHSRHLQSFLRELPLVCTGAEWPLLEWSWIVDIVLTACIHSLAVQNALKRARARHGEEAARASTSGMMPLLRRARADSTRQSRLMRAYPSMRLHRSLRIQRPLPTHPTDTDADSPA
ncbi:hypothetical protein THARTR1_10003 [Trichoderma harzianum]|uniref:Uncharacterized protein n=1 Tax=Trichoderma harzianum TaxID=5544 RepID=A0A2K0TUS9_TRIHA|nr:hypothetical protein THARTR1_10003 [Trichoderma harzianum]